MGRLLFVMSPFLVMLAIVTILPAIGAVMRKREKARKEAEKQEAERIRAEKAAQRNAEAEARKAAKAETAATVKEKLTADDLLPEAPAEVKPFDGEKVAFSGTFPRLEHKQLLEIVTRLGGRGHEAVHAGTTLLVIGPRSGRCKLERAQHWGIKVITWEEWYVRAFGTEPGTEFQPAQ